MRRLIGITGRAQHGKDTTANVLVQEFGFTRLAFADALKSMARALDPIVEGKTTERTNYNSGGSWDATRLIDQGDAYQYVQYTRLADLVESVGWDEAKKNPEVRRFLQALGTEAVRDHLGEDSWVNALNLQAIEVDGDVAISDVRFPNEARYVKKMGGEIWRVVRIDPEGEEFDNGLGVDHPSEKYVASLAVDRELYAVTKDDLERAVRRSVGAYAGATRA